MQQLDSRMHGLNEVLGRHEGCTLCGAECESVVWAYSSTRAIVLW